jgi:transketolase
MSQSVSVTNQELDQLCVNTIRTLAMDAVQNAGSGHPGMPMGMADAAYVLWTRSMKHNPRDPHWPDRDRFVLSAGHGSMLIYALLHLTGYDLPMDELQRLRQWGSKTPGHPEHHLTPGVETTTGPLGQGIANAVGMALAERHLASRFNRPDCALVDHFTYVIVSDGDLMEGISHEACSLAGHLKLDKLIVLYDSNAITLDGPAHLSFSEDIRGRFAAYGWHVQEVDGHAPEEVATALAQARATTDQPSIIITRTHIGFGSPNKQDTKQAHGAALGAEEVALTKQALGWPAEPAFLVPDGVYAHMQQVVQNGQQQQAAWNELYARYQATYPELAAAWERTWSKALPSTWDELLPTFEPDAKGLATRKASGATINALAGQIPALLGGSADLHSSNNTLIDGVGVLSAEAPHNRNIYYGVREHGMGAVMNGMAVHGGVIPYGGTFLTFSDYLRPTIRLAAQMEAQVIYVFTHDSIGLGEDGPTHQPIEHLAALRAIPGLYVLRPGDASETPYAWRAALEHTDGPTALVLSRQNLPVLEPRGQHDVYGELGAAEGVLRGGYVLRSPAGEPDVILLASGSEVSIALDAVLLLRERQIAARVVSMPSWELFAQQDQSYRDSVLPPAVKARVAIEAATTLGWERYVGDAGRIIGIDRYGASAPYKEIYQHYGLTAEHVAAAAADLLGT